MPKWKKKTLLPISLAPLENRSALEIVTFYTYEKYLFTSSFLNKLNEPNVKTKIIGQQNRSNIMEPRAC